MVSTSFRKTIKRNLRKLGLVPPLPPKGNAAAKGKATKAGAAKSHPLPTLNLAVESQVEAGGKVTLGDRAYLPFAASPEVRARVVARIAERAGGIFAELGLPRRDIVADIEDFLASYPKNKAAGRARTTATGSLMWLHLLTRTLNPSLVVESGVFRGASLFTFLRATKKTTKLMAFDIDLSNLAFRNERIAYHEGDWGEALPRATSPTDLCYFDDHINNCLRIRQAYDQGFRHVIFDDSPDVAELHRWRYPGVPTVQMVANRSVLPGEFVEWVWKDKRLTYTFREEDTHGVRPLIKAVRQLPSLSDLVGRPTGIQTYVQLA